jgi:hypothetical protein
MCDREGEGDETNMSDRLNEARRALDAMRAARDDGLTLFGDDADAAVESVTSHESEPWRERALDALYRAARMNLSLTVLDLWYFCAECMEDVLDARAVGGIMREGARRAWIRATDQYRPSSNPAHHGRPLRVWRSLIYRYDDGTAYEWRKRPDAPRGGAA